MQNFATTISPWIVTVDTLETFRCDGYHHEPPLLPYLEDTDNTNFDIPLQVAVKGACAEFCGTRMYISLI